MNLPREDKSRVASASERLDVARRSPPAMTAARAAQDSRLIASLAENIERAWSNVDHQESAFAEIARDELARAAVHQKLCGSELLATVAFASTNRGNVFRQPHHAGPASVGLLQAPRFDIYCEVWLEEASYLGMHDHNGAFQTIDGEVLVSQWAFAEADRVSSKLRFGELGMESVRRLRSGDIATVSAAPVAVYGIGQLGKTVRLSVYARVKTDAMAVHRPGLAFHADVSTALANQSKALKAALRADRTLGLASLETFLLRASLPSVFHVLREARDELGLTALAECNDKLSDRLGARFTTWCGAFEDMTRWASIRRARSAKLDSDALGCVHALCIADDRQSLEQITRDWGLCDDGDSLDDRLCMLLERGVFRARPPAIGAQMLRSLLAGQSPKQAAQDSVVTDPMNERDSSAELSRVLYDDPLLRAAFRSNSS